MKKIYKNLALAFVGVTVLLFFMFTISTFRSDIRIESRHLQEMLTEVHKNIARATKSNEEEYNLLKDDWLNRAEVIQYILKSEDTKADNELMDHLKVLIKAQDIYIVDQNGIIVLSSDDVSVGKILPDPNGDLAAILSNSDYDGYHMYIENPDFWNEPSEVYITLRLAGRFSAVRIYADVSKLNLKSEYSLISEILKAASTDTSTAVVAVGTETGTIVGMTENNDQKFNMYGIQDGSERMDYFGKLSDYERRFKIVNSDLYILMSRREIGYWLVAMTSVNDIVAHFLVQLGEMAVMLVLATLLWHLIMHKNFKKYILDNFRVIDSELTQVLAGNYDMLLSDTNNKELNRLVDVVRKLKNGYAHKAKRMGAILDVFSENIAVFESIRSADYYFFSEKLKNIFGYDDRSWEVIKEKPSIFIDFLKSLDSKKDENNIVCYQNHYIEIHVHAVESDVVGVFIDRTEEVAHRNTLESRLHESEEKQYMDEMTEVLNRSGFEMNVRESLKKNPKNGVLIAMDLDNFKTINDNLGHPIGDKVLIILSDCLKVLFRKDDFIGRIGGDEFFVFIANLSDETVLNTKMPMVLQRVNERLGEYHSQWHVSVSAGLAFVKDADSYEELYRHADEALYTAKHAGKNQFSYYKCF